MNPRNSCFPTICFLLFAVASPALAQTDTPVAPGTTLAQSVQALREQVQELRAAVAEMKAEASQYRAESEQLRKELERLRGAAPPTGAATAPDSAAVERRLSTVEESTHVLESELRAQYQSKVESASKYRLRLSGLVLLNLFSDRGFVDNQDFPTYAAGSGLYGARATFGATLRQSELGFEVFGPQLLGARTSGEVRFDFGGGFPAGAPDGINTGLVRLRTASMRMDWADTSIIAGQDNLFISPLSPTSFASLVVPSLGYSGNLWAWTPQIRVEHKVNLSDRQNVLFQAGVLDNITGEPSPAGDRLPQAGESTGQPAYALRTSWNGILNGRPVSLGASGYYSRQNWGPYWEADGYAAAADWRIPVLSRVELSGEFYRGRGVGGLGGGIGQSVLFSSTPQYPAPSFRALNSVGGWSQLKFIATPKLEFNGAFGMDNPFANDIRSIASPITYYPVLLTANRSGMANFVFRPRSDLLVSGEYRHLHTTEIGRFNTADQVNLTMGVLF